MATATKTNIKNSAKEKSVEKKDAKKGADKLAGHPFIKSPRITEKSALDAERGAYTFNVMESANKSEIKKAIKALYGVTPVKIAITQISQKVVTRGNMRGVKGGGKKAIVHLKKGDKIIFA